ncbi:protein HUA2-LIKE 3 isoform X1 [Dendrobium catenatum]|uniref:protein HUA2-LIKE 3 isoform X1 n=1 Tax=Dendrobium catenatum TaxID=906689 RepID=UPI0009F74203|nr:protein HUA2-LIKE 3 isoform X1 [Dendrobium catenatum]
MAPNRRKGSARAAAAAAAVQQQWNIGDLVLAKMKGFPAWPAMISEPEKWGFSSDRKKLLVYFYGTKQIFESLVVDSIDNHTIGSSCAFCNHADIEAFTEEKKKSLLIKRQGKGADFVRAVEEIIDVYESLKKQNLARAISNDGEDEDNVSDQVHLEDSRIDCFGKPVEPSLSPSPNHELESASVTQCGDKVNVDDNPGTLLNCGNHYKTAVVDDSAKKKSILDELRQIPLSSMPTTRKRARDSLIPSSVTKSAPSRRRSRSSLANNPCESQKSSTKLDAKLKVGCSASSMLQEEPTPKEQVVVREHLETCSAEASPDSTRAPLDDNLAVNTDGTNLGDVNVLEFSGKLECSDNDTVSNTVAEGDARLSSKVEIPLNTLEFKARRKYYRKQVSSARACDEMDKKMDDLQAEGGSLSHSTNSQNGATEKFSNANGDEHLPLVKRARVRMGKPSMEEENLKECVGSKVKLGNLDTSNGHYGSNSFSSPVKNCPLQNGSSKRSSPVAMEFARFSTNGSSHNNTGSDLLSCKRNKHHLMLDVEAALPPSKRLHRALEAMSANAAEAAIDCPQAPIKTEIKSSDCLSSSTENAHSGDASVRFPVKTLPMQTSCAAAFDSSICGLSSSSTSQNLVACRLTSSEAKHDDINPGKVLNPLETSSLEIGTGSCYHSPFSSKITSTVQSSSLELVEKHCSEHGPNNSFSSAVEENDRSQLDKECTYSEVARVSPQANNTCNSQQLTCLSPSSGAATAVSITTTMCTASEIDGTAAGSDIVNVDSASDMNGIPSVSSATNVSSATTICSLPSDLDGAAAASVTTNFSSSVNCTSMATLSSSQFEQTSRGRDMQNITLDAKQTPKDRSILSKLAPIKDLIAAAQAKRFLSRSTSMCDSVIDGKIAPDAVVSPTLINKEDSSGRGSPSNPMFYQRPASDDGTCHLQNGSRTPLDGSSRKGFSKYMNHSEANAARRCFESLLCTLSRTKDSIGRATRLAIDCAKYGIAGEVIDILLQYLEKESSLHRRVDLFFLVDSITQCSRCQKGGPGDVYPSLVQAVLPRLLSAAAPPGNAASENRRQCLKVLRLWLERRTLPEFTVRHHIRELEYGNEASLSISYSRRPPRTERPLNDPVREMEGMLVDEYGSNASFQLPQFLNTRILEDDEGSASDDKGFEAVTPDRNAEVDCEKGTTPLSAEKHCHVLEEVDGELEMEDVAPPCGLEASQSTCHVKGAELVSNCNHKCEQNNLFSFAPPLPEDRPPSPPPLPSSPPPVPQLCSGKAPHPLAASTAVDNTDFGSSYNTQNQLLRPISQQPNSMHCSSSLSESSTFYSQGYVGHLQQIPQLACTSSSSYINLGGSQPAVPVGNNSQSIVNIPPGNKIYHLQPPPPVVSNQFSYIQAQPQHRPQAPGNQSSYSDRYHAHDNQRGFIPIDVSDRSAFYPSVHAGSIGLTPDKVEAPHAPSALYGPQLDPSSAPCQDWSYLPRTSGYSLSASRQSLENPVSAPAYWRAR